MAKRALDDTATDTATDLYDGLVTAGDLPSSLKGLTVSCAGPLVYAEDAKYTFHLSPAIFGECVEVHEGTFADTVSSSTDLVVIGMLEKEWTQKNPDTWTDCGKHKAIKKQKTSGGLKARKGNALHVVKFEEFVRAYDLTAWMENNVLTAKYTGAKSKKQGPGRARAKGTIAGLTTMHFGFMPDGKLGPPVRGQYHLLHRSEGEALDVD